MFILGCFTIVRLVETSIENIVCRRRIETIRQYYAALDTRHRGFFQPEYGGGGLHGVHHGGGSVLFTMASMVLLVNAVLDGATAALICILGVGLSAPAGITAGVLVAVATLVFGLVYEYRRLGPLIRGDARVSGT